MALKYHHNDFAICHHNEDSTKQAITMLIAAYFVQFQFSAFSHFQLFHLVKWHKKLLSLE